MIFLEIIREPDNRLFHPRNLVRLDSIQGRTGERPTHWTNQEDSESKEMTNYCCQFSSKPITRTMSRTVSDTDRLCVRNRKGSRYV